MSATVLQSRAMIRLEAIRRLAQRQIVQRQEAKPEAVIQEEQRAVGRASQHARRAYPLHQFVTEAWPLIEPQPFIDGWHLEAQCAHLEAVTETAAATDLVPSDLPEIRNLVISVPPRSSKSIVGSILWPAWVWLTWPACRWLCASYSAPLALSHATLSRTLMQTPWYHEQKRVPWVFTSDQRIKSYFSNSAQGYRITTSVSGMATGLGADIRLGDDIHDTSEDFSVSRADLVAAVQFWTQTLATRVTNAKRACQVLVGQRVANDDVSAAVLKQGDYVQLRIPMEFEAEHVAPPTPLGWVDPRTEEGALLCPERFGPAELEPLKRQLGHRYFPQFQQRIVTELSSLFPKPRWRFFYVWPDPAQLTLIQSWDMRFKDAKDSGSYVAGHLWARAGPPESGQLLLLDRVFARLSFGESCDAMEDLSRKWPGAYAKLVENKANGPAIYNVLRSKIFGIVLVAVDGQHGSKYARAEAQAVHQKAERAWLPHPSLAPWVEEYMDYMERFPGEPNDDADATSQAWAYLCPMAPAKDTLRDAEAARVALGRQILQARQREQRGRLSKTGA